jgi:hypothetical protein
MRWIIVFVLGIVFLTGCDTLSSTAPTSPLAAATSQSTDTAQVATTPNAYPAPQGAYPAPQGTAAAGTYPAPTLKQGPKFTLNEPIKASDSQVSGTGQSGVTIKLIDITSGGQNLGETTVGADGNYTFDVAGKLKSGNWLAVQLGSSQSAGINPEDFISGPGYQDTPFVGVVFVSAHVQ